MPFYNSPSDINLTVDLASKPGYLHIDRTIYAASGDVKTIAADPTGGIIRVKDAYGALDLASTNNRILIRYQGDNVPVLTEIMSIAASADEGFDKEITLKPVILNSIGVTTDPVIKPVGTNANVVVTENSIENIGFIGNFPFSWNPGIEYGDRRDETGNPILEFTTGRKAMFTGMVQQNSISLFTSGHIVKEPDAGSGLYVNKDGESLDEFYVVANFYNSINNNRTIRIVAPRVSFKITGEIPFGKTDSKEFPVELSILSSPLLYDNGSSSFICGQVDLVAA